MATYEWSPDFTTIIDRSKYPDYRWREADPGGGSEGAPARAAGFYKYGADGWGTSFRADHENEVGDGPATYQQLKDAGLWNLADQNSPTWKYLQANAGGADPRTDPSALFNALVNAHLLDASSRDERGVQTVQNNIREALGGLDPQIADKFANAAGQAIQGYWTSSKQSENQGILKDIGDVGQSFKDIFTQTPLLPAAIAAGAGALGFGAGAGGEAAGSTFGGATGALGTAEAPSLGAAFGGGALSDIAAPFLGPATGAIESAPVIGASGSPIVSGVATGAGDFLPTAAGLAGGDLGPSESFVGPTTGTVENAPIIGASGTPTVAGAATGGGEFLPAASASTGGTAVGTGMPAAVPQTAASLEGQGLAQTGAGQFETMPATLGGAGAATPLGAGVAAGVPAAGAAGASGGGTAAATAGAAAAGTPLSRILDGSATTADYLSLGGNIGAAGLGAYAADRQASAMSELADKYLAIGAPSRGRYEASFAPGFSMTNEPGYQGALDQTTEAFLRKASMQGNPAGNPGAWAETLKGVNNSLALPALYNYRNQNASTGGYNAFNTAAPGAATGAIGAQAGVYNAIGAGAADVFNPRPAPITLNDIYRTAARGGLA